MPVFAVEKLPPELRTRIDAAMRVPPPGYAAARAYGPGKTIAAMIFGLPIAQGLPVLYALQSEVRLRHDPGTLDEMLLTMSFVVLVGWIVVLGSIRKTIARARARPPAGVVVTPAVFASVDERTGSVALWPIADVVAGIQGGLVTRSYGGQMQHRTASANEARAVVTAVAASQAGAASAAGGEHDWIAALERAGTPQGEGAGSGRFGRAMGTFGLALVATVSALGAAWTWYLARAEEWVWANEPLRYADLRSEMGLRIAGELLAPIVIDPEREATSLVQRDENAWQHALQSVPALREYVRTSPPGRHAAEALPLLQGRYAEASARIAATALAGGGDPALVQGVQALFGWYGANLDTQSVAVTFVPDRGIDQTTFEAAARAVAGQSPVAPAWLSFTPERNAPREQSVAMAIDLAMRRLVGTDYFSLDRARTDDSVHPRFLVRWRVVPSEEVYTSSADRDLPEAQRTAYPGIRIELEATIQVPPAPGQPLPADPTIGFRFATTASPAPHFTVEGATTPEERVTRAYDTMAATAFGDVTARLARALGSPLPPPTPPPPLPAPVAP